MMNKELLCFSVYDMEIYLGECFFRSIPDRPPRPHTHPCYELVCLYKNGDMEFIITPPLLEHISADAACQSVTSLLFDFNCKKSNSFFRQFQLIKEQLTVHDAFDGVSRITSIKRLVKENSFGAMEQIRAELELLFIGLIRTVNSAERSAIKPVHLLDRERMLRLEEYFNIHLKDPNCSKKQLAEELGVCERQLTRILSNTYSGSFSKILLRSRMTLAEAMRKEGNKSTDEILKKVGYTSLTSFKRAYRNFFGHDYIQTIKKDIEQQNTSSLDT